MSGSRTTRGEGVLRGVSFKVALRERAVIIGPTGSGETTIISLLLRLYPMTPDSGLSTHDSGLLAVAVSNVEI